MVAFTIRRLVNNSLVNEEASFQLEHLCADVANEPEVVVDASQVWREVVAALEADVALATRELVDGAVEVPVKHSGRSLVRMHQDFVNLLVVQRRYSTVLPRRGSSVGRASFKRSWVLFLWRYVGLNPGRGIRWYEKILANAARTFLFCVMWYLAKKWKLIARIGKIIEKSYSAAVTVCFLRIRIRYEAMERYFAGTILTPIALHIVKNWCCFSCLLRQIDLII